MQLDQIRALIRTLPGTKESIKWGQHVVFDVCDKMFLIVSSDRPLPFGITIKVHPDDYALVSQAPGFTPAPYLARHAWVATTIDQKFSEDQLEQMIREAYSVVRAKLPRKLRDSLD